MSQTDIMRTAVRIRLEQWGLEFALDRDRSGIGFDSMNILYKMQMRRGLISPGRGADNTAEAQEIELIVTDIARVDLRTACCMRGYYCGSMRRKVERFEKALELATRHRIKKFSLRTYLNDVEMGSAMVRIALFDTGRLAFDNLAPHPPISAPS